MITLEINGEVYHFETSSLSDVIAELEKLGYGLTEDLWNVKLFSKGGKSVKMIVKRMTLLENFKSDMELQ